MKIKSTNLTLSITAFIACILLMTFESSAQRVIMEQDVNADTTVPNFGKNRQNYSSSFFDLGFAVGESVGDSAPSTLLGRSWSFKYGMNYKLRVSNFYSVLGQVAYKRAAYYYDVDDLLLVDEAKSHKLIMNNVMGEISNRFNFGKRGNFIGYYLEIGASADFNFMNKTKTVIEKQDGTNYEKSKISLHGLDFIEALAYNAHVRVGMNKFVLFADYRLTNRFVTTDFMDYQLTPLTVGLRIDLGA